MEGRCEATDGTASKEEESKIATKLKTTDDENSQFSRRTSPFGRLKMEHPRK